MAFFCVLFCAITCIAILPHLGVILVAFSRDWYGTILPTDWTLGHFSEDALGHNLTLPSIQNSLRNAPALPRSWISCWASPLPTSSCARNFGREALDAIAMLPSQFPVSFWLSDISR
jgi:iron(III) transport system permease protein